MAKRQRIWAAKCRDKIFDELGRKCNYCGSTEELEFDLIIPYGNNDHHRKMDWSWRMSFYRKELRRCNLQVLCSPCNSRKKNQLELSATEPSNEPF